jgi:hypothetical protein
MAGRKWILLCVQSKTLKTPLPEAENHRLSHSRGTTGRKNVLALFCRSSRGEGLPLKEKTGNSVSIHALLDKQE